MKTLFQFIWFVEEKILQRVDSIIFGDFYTKLSSCAKFGLSLVFYFVLYIGIITGFVYLADQYSREPMPPSNITVKVEE